MDRADIALGVAASIARTQRAAGSRLRWHAMPFNSTDHDEGAIFHEGIALFNEGEWFEAHESWEDIWHMAAGPRKLFYQGLIQCAVTLEHMRRGNPRGVVTVYE